MDIKIVPLRELLSEIIYNHADPDNPDYNECDIDLCGWCWSAKAHIAAMDDPRPLPETIDNSHYGREDLYNHTRAKPARSVQVTYKRTGKLKPRQFPLDEAPPE